MQITIGLTPSDIAYARREIRKYKNSLSKKCSKFVSKLAAKGITVAKQNTGEFGGYIVFEKHVDAETYGARGFILATQTGLIRREWRTNATATGVTSADISPLLMAEFGAGIKHDKNKHAHQFGMGAGTFPGQTHAFDPDGWWYLDMNWEWQHADGIEPGMPMTRAAEEMERQIFATAQEVFAT